MEHDCPSDVRNFFQLTDKGLMAMTDIQKVRWRRVVREVAGLALLIVSILAARSTLADHYHVPSGSMEYTLMSGDRVVVDKRAYGLRVPFTNIKVTEGLPVARGDVVIFDSPQNGIRLIKRIVATGGDHVSIKDGRLYINGVAKSIASDIAVELIGGKSVRLNLADGGGIDWAGQLANGQVLAVGDHRGNSTDGRVFGTIDEHQIYGRALGVYYRRDEGFGWRPL